MSLTLRAYNVLFGDCLLVSWDEDDGEHHAWIDFGNFHNDSNAVFENVYDSVRRITGGKLDLMIVTHRHLDHLEGFHVMRKKMKNDFSIERLWHAHVTPQADSLFTIADMALRSLMPAAVQAGRGEIGRIWRNNVGDFGMTTKARMDAIIEDAGIAKNRVFALHRGTKLTAKVMPPGVKKLRIELLAPERNSNVYLRPLVHALQVHGFALDGGSAHRSRSRASGRNGKGGRSRGRHGETEPSLERLDPFADHEAVRFYDSEFASLADFARLRRQLRTSGLDLLAAVDKTRNNTSLVMRWTYGNTRLLFTGDAEETSWEKMRMNKAPFSADVIKVGHHGSINASPTWSFAEVLARKAAGNAAVVSTDRNRFTGENEVPKAEVLAGWRGRLTSANRLFRTDRKKPGEPVVVRL